MPLCSICHSKNVCPSRRLYCGPVCARRAASESKREIRRKSRADWMADGCPKDAAPWKDGWSSDEHRKAWFAAYMRSWRRQRSPRQRDSPMPIGAVSGAFSERHSMVGVPR